MTELTRRRFISIAAAGAGLVIVPKAAWPDDSQIRWSGTAMGADATITLAHPDRQLAETALAAARAEIERLEAIFSLHRPGSAISRLNRSGQLPNPPFDLLTLLAEAGRVHDLTAGAFDPTVQPVWVAFADHFSEPLPIGTAPNADILEAARTRIGWRRVEFEPAMVRFGEPAMALTLNGIAQGYVTDKVADLLRAAGFGNVLVELGELRALGGHADGTPWRIELSSRNGEISGGSVDLVDRAVATSAPRGTTFDAGAQVGHIIDPKTGLPAGKWAQASVVAPTATLADGLSTAFCLMEQAEIATVLSQTADVLVRLVDEKGAIRQLPA